ncbi:MAG: hypothetical protein PSV13_12285 [Lacunisphaera sp.]|nr:hypothetical protein [Lacunisphaera sp.]
MKLQLTFLVAGLGLQAAVDTPPPINERFAPPCRLPATPGCSQLRPENQKAPATGQSAGALKWCGQRESNP